MKSSIIALVSVICFGLISCGTSKNTAKEGVDISGELYSTKWKITELNGKPVPDKVNGQEPFMSFSKADKLFSASGGCNVINGTFNLKPNNTVKFSQGMTTMMACNDMTVEQSILQLTTKADNIQIKEGILTIMQGKKVLAKLVAGNANTKAAIDGTWELDYILNLNSDENLKVLFPNGKPNITFNTAENKVNGNSGCNNFFGSFSTSDTDSIKFGALGMTRKACPGNGESLFTKHLDEASNYLITEEGLSLIIDHITVLRFKKK